MSNTLWLGGIAIGVMIAPEIWLAVVATAVIGKFVIVPLLYPK